MEDFKHREERYERESKRNGIIVAIVTHSLLLLFFLVTMAWTPPDPPPPKFGIEVNFGFESEGSGTVQNKTKPNKSEGLEKAKPNPEPTPKPVETPKPVPTPTPETKPVEAVKPKVQEVIPVQETAEKAVEVPKVEEPTPKPKPTPTPTPTPNPSPEPPKETGGSAADNTGTSDTDVANNQGSSTNPDAVGDEGTQQGSLNEKALLGGGSGGGAELNLDGWRWDTPPTVSDGSSEVGSVTIRFKIDEEGTVISAAIATGYTVTPRVAEFYRQYVEQDMTFSPKVNSGKLPKFTLGSITFILKST